MENKKSILAIIGSASSNSSNLRLVEKIASWKDRGFHLTIYDGLKALPHFDPELSASDPPRRVTDFRNSIEQAHGIIICTPEYVFSIPSGLKNAIEWCISTTVFSDKPMALITASASGEKGHEQLQLIMGTAMARFTGETCMLIQGIKGKFDHQGNLADPETERRLAMLIDALVKLME